MTVDEFKEVLQSQWRAGIAVLQKSDAPAADLMQLHAIKDRWMDIHWRHFQALGCRNMVDYHTATSNASACAAAYGVEAILNATTGDELIKVARDSTWRFLGINVSEEDSEVMTFVGSTLGVPLSRAADLHIYKTFPAAFT